MIRLFVVALCGVAVKDRASESRAFDRIPIATPGHVAAREYKFEFPATGFAKERNGTAAETVLAGIVLDLVHDFVRVFRTVEVPEDFANHGLLIFVEKFRDG